MAELTEKISSDEENIHAAFGQRLIAYVIDSIILIPIVGGLTIINMAMWQSIAVLVILQVIDAVYKPLMEGKFGATLGKMSIGLKVVDTNYQPINTKMAFVRAIPFILKNILTSFSGIYVLSHTGVIKIPLLYQIPNYIGWLVVIISCLLIFKDNLNRTFHDKLAKTYCIHRKTVFKK